MPNDIKGVKIYRIISTHNDAPKSKPIDINPNNKYKIPRKKGIPPMIPPFTQYGKFFQFILA